MSLDVTVTPVHPDIAVVALRGMLSGSGNDRALEAVLDAIEGGRPRVVIDLQEVGFMDSSALGALLRAYKAARARGGDLRIARPSWQAVLVFQLTNLDQVFTFYDDPTTAYSEA